MQRHVNHARTANQKKWINTKRTAKPKDDWVRVIIPDLHGASMDVVAVEAMFNDLRHFDIDEIVMTGDMIECGGFLAQHHTLGFVAQTEYTYENDIAATNQFLDTLLEVCPKVREIHYIEGNHENRVEKWCVTMALKNRHEAEWLRNQVGIEKVLELDKRGIKFYRQSSKYHGLGIPGTIKLGKCFFTHGISTAKHAASVHVQRFGGNIWFGHTHRGDSWDGHTVVAGHVGGWNAGCLCVKQPLWQHTNPTQWIHGYGVDVVAKSGNFQPFRVRIEDGESMWLPLVKHTRGKK
jgi:predicted phosphodiesterase